MKLIKNFCSETVRDNQAKYIILEAGKLILFLGKDESLSNAIDYNLDNNISLLCL